MKVLRDTHIEFELGYIAADIQRREEREQREESKKQQRGEDREEARRSQTEQEDILQMAKTVAEKDQEQRGVRVKWPQRVEEKPTHLLSFNPGTRKDIR